MTYYVFMIDLKNSTLMDKDTRVRCQNMLNTAKQIINSMFHKDGLELVFASGDSIQGFSTNASIVFKACIIAQYIMFPVEIHAGIGSGELYINWSNEPEGSNSCDGPAYHSAKKCIIKSRDEVLDCVIDFSTSLISIDVLFNTILKTIQSIKESNTTLQNSYLAAYVLLVFTDQAPLAIQNISTYKANKNIEVVEIQNVRDILPPQLLTKLFDVTIQNVRTVLKRSFALEISDLYQACLSYLIGSCEDSL